LAATNTGLRRPSTRRTSVREEGETTAMARRPSWARGKRKCWANIDWCTWWISTTGHGQQFVGAVAVAAGFPKVTQRARLVRIPRSAAATPARRGTAEHPDGQPQPGGDLVDGLQGAIAGSAVDNHDAARHGEPGEAGGDAGQAGAHRLFAVQDGQDELGHSGKGFRLWRRRCRCRVEGPPPPLRDDSMSHLAGTTRCGAARYR
jgi:hypothetical protein